MDLKLKAKQLNLQSRLRSWDSIYFVITATLDQATSWGSNTPIYHDHASLCRRRCNKPQREKANSKQKEKQSKSAQPDIGMLCNP
jgi:hypothetical protein